MALSIERRWGYKFKALQMSLAVHAVVLLTLIGAGSSLKPSDKLLVIDFRMEDSPNSGDRTFAASEIKPHRDTVRQKVGNAKKTQRKEKAQVSTNDGQKQEAPVHTTPEILETSVSENPQIISQINPDARPADTVQSFAMLAGSHNISPGKTGSPDGSTRVKGVITTGNTVAYGRGLGGPNGLTADYLRKNFFYIRDMIQKRIIYPPLARRMGWEGKVTISFIIVSDGRVKNMEVKESSGRDIFDKSAIETIRTASPFPAPPIEAQIIIPILYRLN